MPLKFWCARRTFANGENDNNRKETEGKVRKRKPRIMSLVILQQQRQ